MYGIGKCSEHKTQGVLTCTCLKHPLNRGHGMIRNFKWEMKLAHLTKIFYIYFGELAEVFFKKRPQTNTQPQFVECWSVSIAYRCTPVPLWEPVLQCVQQYVTEVLPVGCCKCNLLCSSIRATTQNIEQADQEGWLCAQGLLEPLQLVVERRLLHKLLNIIDNNLHPLHDLLIRPDLAGDPCSSTVERTIPVQCHHTV